MKPRVTSTQLVATSFINSANTTVMMTKRWPRVRRITEPSRSATTPTSRAAAGRPTHIDHLSRTNSSPDVYAPIAKKAACASDSCPT
jgi:hypothetical protein